MADPFKKLPGARVTLAPWSQYDGPSVVACVGVDAQAAVLRSMSLSDLLELAGDHILDMFGDDVLAAELHLRAEAAK